MYIASREEEPWIKRLIKNMEGVPVRVEEIRKYSAINSAARKLDEAILADNAKEYERAVGLFDEALDVMVPPSSWIKSVQCSKGVKDLVKKIEAATERVQYLRSVLATSSNVSRAALTRQYYLARASSGASDCTITAAFEFFGFVAAIMWMALSVPTGNLAIVATACLLIVFMASIPWPDPDWTSIKTEYCDSSAFLITRWSVLCSSLFWLYGCIGGEEEVHALSTMSLLAKVVVRYCISMVTALSIYLMLRYEFIPDDGITQFLLRFEAGAYLHSAGFSQARRFAASLVAGALHCLFGAFFGIYKYPTHLILQSAVFQYASYHCIYLVGLILVSIYGSIEVLIRKSRKRMQKKEKDSYYGFMPSERW